MRRALLDSSSRLEITGFYPRNGDVHPCVPGGDTVRRMSARITAVGDRAYPSSAGTLQVIQLE